MMHLLFLTIVVLAASNEESLLKIRGASSQEEAALQKEFCPRFFDEKEAMKIKDSTVGDVKALVVSKCLKIGFSDEECNKAVEKSLGEDVDAAYVADEKHCEVLMQLKGKALMGKAKLAHKAARSLADKSNRTAQKEEEANLSPVEVLEKKVVLLEQKQRQLKKRLANQRKMMKNRQSAGSKLAMDLDRALNDKNTAPAPAPAPAPTYFANFKSTPDCSAVPGSKCKSLRTSNDGAFCKKSSRGDCYTHVSSVDMSGYE